MKLQEIYKIADELAPFLLSQEYIKKFGAYDNSGALVDCAEEIKKVLFSLDLSRGAIEEAERGGANCIFTHHPAIFQPIKQLGPYTNDSLVCCIRKGISVISSHLNLDAAPGGIDESLMEGLGGKESYKIYEELTGGGYGRIYDVGKTSLAEFVARAKKTLAAERVLVYGNGAVERVASFCGAGLSDGALIFARSAGADTVVSADLKHHLIARAVENGMNVVQLTHYASECYGFEKFYEKMKERLGIPCVFFREDRLL